MPYSPLLKASLSLLRSPATAERARAPVCGCALASWLVPGFLPYQSSFGGVPRSALSPRQPERWYRIRVNAESGEDGTELPRHCRCRKWWTCCGLHDPGVQCGLIRQRRPLATAVLALAAVVAIVRLAAAAAIVSAHVSGCDHDGR